MSKMTQPSHRRTRGTFVWSSAHGVGRSDATLRAPATRAVADAPWTQRSAFAPRPKGSRLDVGPGARFRAKAGATLSGAPAAPGPRLRRERPAARAAQLLLPQSASGLMRSRKPLSTPARCYRSRRSSLKRPSCARADSLSGSGSACRCTTFHSPSSRRKTVVTRSA
jgi:hypothetical protein